MSFLNFPKIKFKIKFSQNKILSVPLLKILSPCFCASLWFKTVRYTCCALACFSLKVSNKCKKEYDTRCSQAVSHPSTIRAQWCLTWQIWRDAVFSPWYGRTHLFTLHAHHLSIVHSEEWRKSFFVCGLFVYVCLSVCLCVWVCVCVPNWIEKDFYWKIKLTLNFKWHNIKRFFSIFTKIEKVFFHVTFYHAVHIFRNICDALSMSRHVRYSRWTLVKKCSALLYFTAQL